MPPIKIQMIFIRMLRQPPALSVVRTSRPKGQRARMESFSVWMPKGMPMMVIIRTRLEIRYSTAVMRPPKRSQMMLPRKFMLFQF